LSIVRNGKVARPGAVLGLVPSPSTAALNRTPTSTATAISTSELTLMPTMIQKS
jgi:hypothetical protein